MLRHPSGRAYRLALANLGCRVNRYEADAVLQQFQAEGFEVVDFQEEADVYIVNSCAVTNEAARKSGQFLRRARKFNSEAIVVGMGCLQALEGEHKDADLSIGSKGKSQICERVLTLLQEREAATKRLQTLPVSMQRLMQDALLTQQLEEVPSGRDVKATPHRPEGALDGKRFGEYEEFGLVTRQTEVKAFVKIQDGCNQFCAFCTIPLARGRVCSRQPQAVIDEVSALVEAGYQEVTLTGIHVCSYGVDFGRDSMALMDLCDELAKIEGLKRLRFGSVEPLSITDDFIQRFAQNPKLCHHLHLSMQSGSSELLKRMRRQYDANQYLHVVEELRRHMPDFTVTTDVICGFPGETEAMHQETLAFCRTCQFLHLHVFRFAPRPMTAAATMKEQVPASISERRSKELIALSDELLQASFARRIGEEDEVLLEQKAILSLSEGQLLQLPPGTEVWKGYGKTYHPVYVLEGSKQIYEAGQILRVRYSASTSERLIAVAKE